MLLNRNSQQLVLRHKSFLINPGFTFRMATVLSFKLKVLYSTWRQISQLCSLKREAKEDFSQLICSCCDSPVNHFVAQYEFLSAPDSHPDVEHLRPCCCLFAAVLYCCFGAVTTFYCPIQPPLHLSETPPKFWTIKSQCSYFPMHSFVNFKNSILKMLFLPGLQICGMQYVPSLTF